MKVLKSVKQLSVKDIRKLFDSSSYLNDNKVNAFDHLKNKYVGTIFFEPSTRTQLSFQRAVQALGGRLLTISDISQSRSNMYDCESIADTLKVISLYCDCIIFRNKKSIDSLDIESICSPALFINAGDGQNEHPTQALNDCWVLSGKVDFINLSFGFLGDCSARVFRSLYFLLYKLGVMEFHYYTVNSGDFPPDIYAHSQKNNTIIIFHDNIKDFLASSDAIEIIPYTIPDHASIKRNSSSEITITKELINKCNPGVWLLHPGPRNFELCSSTDCLPNSLYFEQAEKSLYMKMSVLSFMFGNTLN